MINNGNDEKHTVIQKRENRAYTCLAVVLIVIIRTRKKRLRHFLIFFWKNGRLQMIRTKFTNLRENNSWLKLNFFHIKIRLKSKHSHKRMHIIAFNVNWCQQFHMKRSLLSLKIPRICRSQFIVSVNLNDERNYFDCIQRHPSLRPIVVQFDEMRKSSLNS